MGMVVSKEAFIRCLVKCSGILSFVVCGHTLGTGASFGDPAGTDVIWLFLPPLSPLVHGHQRNLSAELSPVHR